MLGALVASVCASVSHARLSSALSVPRLRPLSAPPVAAAAASAAEVDALTDFVSRSRALLVLTGAGVSTGSGIPDYRGVNGSYRRGHTPVQHGEFVGALSHRQRYWARSMLGYWPFSRARPNAAHRALAKLQAHGHVSGGLITQNVDGLHQRAGSVPVLDLHGRIDACRCVRCGSAESRLRFQHRLEALNPHWLDVDVVELRADADAQLANSDYASFRVPPCEACELAGAAADSGGGGGFLKPDVVFFGGSLAAETVRDAATLADGCDALLVVGSTCSTYSAFRLVERASRRGAPVALLNLGETRMHGPRGVPLALDVEASCGETLSLLAERLVRRADHES
jgi:NAD-dependent SIR2 family protein deacetylase